MLGGFAHDTTSLDPAEALCARSAQPGWGRLRSLLSLFKEQKMGRKNHVESPKALHSLQLKRGSSEVPPLIRCLYVLGENDLN